MRASSTALAAACFFVLAACARPPAPAPAPQPGPGIAALSERLSEPGGFFQSDNLVSNETSYLHVLGRMGELGVQGGAYLGVGPDQNFSYIAAIRPQVAFIIDIRRDNLLHQLLFKALFEHAHNRIEFLCLLTGRPLPAGDLKAWERMSIDSLVNHVDAHPGDAARFEAAASLVRESVQAYSHALSDPDLSTIRRIHLAFYQFGLGLRYSNRGSHPAYRQLLLETDLDGVQRNYLADEASFRFVKDLQRRNLVIPVVGDLAGPHALRAIGREVAARNLSISAFYVSNVEQYLMQEPGVFERFAETVTRLPFEENSVIIRSYFSRGARHAQSVPGHASTQLLERISTFTEQQRKGGYRTYGDLVTRNVLRNRK